MRQPFNQIAGVVYCFNVKKYAASVETAISVTLFYRAVYTIIVTWCLFKEYNWRLRYLPVIIILYISNKSYLINKVFTNRQIKFDKCFRYLYFILRVFIGIVYIIYMVCIPMIKRVDKSSFLFMFFRLPHTPM